MACNCSKGPRADNGMMVHSSRLTITDTGLFEILDTGSEDDVPYDGVYQSADVWAVALGTPMETYFLRGHRQQARDLYKQLSSEGRTTIDHVLARNCRRGDMIAILGA